MPFSYIIDRPRRLVITIGEGQVTFAEIDAHQKRLLADPAFDPSFDQIADLSRVTESAVTPDEVRLLAARRVFAAGSRRVAIAAADMPFALARMFETYRELFGGAETIKIVRTRDEALAWYQDHPSQATA